MPLPTAAEDAGPPVAAGADLRARLCGDRKRCEIRRERGAGRDRQGRAMAVVSLYLGPESTGGDMPAELEDPKASSLGITEGDREDTISPVMVPSACQRFEYWLVVRENGAIAAARPLVGVCNEGHGAAGVGEDVVKIDEGSLDYTTSGGSSWRWSERTVLALAPLRVVRTESSGGWSLGANEEQIAWSFDDFEGSVRWYSPPCKPDGSPPDGDPVEARSDEAFAYASIPAVDTGDDYASSGWKTAALGRCSLLVDSGGSRGFVVHGKPGAEGDASMRVVASRQRELFVEVRDDRKVGPGARWIHDDHLELWLGKSLPGYMDHCLQRRAEPSQWGVRIADGKVFAGRGKPDPKAIGVDRFEAPDGAVRLKLTLPPGLDAITLVYSDSDDGRTQERLIATSRLVTGKIETLGALRPIDPKQATCRVDGGRLEPVLAPIPDGDKPVL
jgi:hypothetical protein